MHFLKSENKEAYYNKFNEILNVLKKTKYDISETWALFWTSGTAFRPRHTVFESADGRLFYESDEKMYDEVEKLFRWSKKEPDKNIVTQDGLAYLESPLTRPRHTVFESADGRLFYESDEKMSRKYRISSSLIQSCSAGPKKSPIKTS
jgi:hypothetical protein